MSIIQSSTADHNGVSRNDTMTDWLQLISAEYRELPDLCLTKAQVRRLWNLDGITVRRYWRGSRPQDSCGVRAPVPIYGRVHDIL